MLRCLIWTKEKNKKKRNLVILDVFLSYWTHNHDSWLVTVASHALYAHEQPRTNTPASDWNLKMAKYPFKYTSQRTYGWMQSTPQLNVSDKRDIGCVWNHPLFVVVDVIKCAHSVPQCTIITSAQPMYTQWLENTHNAQWEPRSEWIPAFDQKMAPAAESSIHSFTKLLVQCCYSIISYR